MNKTKLLNLLEQTHKKYIREREIENDAIAPALKYKSKRDREFAALICAVLAYGRIGHIKVSVRKLLYPMGKRPVAWLTTSNLIQIRSSIRGWKHRFNDEEDMYNLLVRLRELYLNHKSLEVAFGISQMDTAHIAIAKIVESLNFVDVLGFSPRVVEKKSFHYLLTHPKSGSACKRLNLYLRWMVGTSEFDFGLWKRFSKKNLIIPLDTHILRQAKKLKLCKRSTPDWKMAEEITKSLRRLDSEDPTRFDFALCHLSINS